MATGSPRELDGNFEKPKVNLAGTPAEDVSMINGIEAQSIHREHGEELTKEFATIAAPLDKAYQEFEASRLEIAASRNFTEEGRQDAIAKEAAPLVKMISQIEKRTEILNEEVVKTDANFLKAGEVTRPDSIPESAWRDAINGVNYALEGKDSEPLEREIMYRDACEMMVTTMPWLEKSVVMSNVAAMEARQVFQKLQGAMTGNLVPFVSPELVRDMRMKRARVQMIAAAKKRDQNSRLSAALGSVSTFARRRVEKFVPSLIESEVEVL